MLDLFWTWASIGGGYLIAILLIVGGGYLAFVLGANPLNPLTKTFHYLGMALMGIGSVIGAINYGKGEGATECQAAWKAKNYEAQIERLKQEAEAKKIAANFAADLADQLTRQNDDLQKQVVEYSDAASKFPVCRHASDDDDRRMCDLTGRSAPGCKPAR